MIEQWFLIFLVSEILSFCVKIVNSIKTRLLQSRMFLKPGDELHSEHSSLLLHEKVNGCRKGK